MYAVVKQFGRVLAALFSVTTFLNVQLQHMPPGAASDFMLHRMMSSFFAHAACLRKHCSKGYDECRATRETSKVIAV